MCISSKVSLLLSIGLFLVVLSEARIRLRYRTRPECRDKIPRRSDEFPDVVLTGLVEQVYPSINDSHIYSGSVYVKRVLKGPKTLSGNKITVQGFGDSTLCHSNVRKRDSWIFLLTEVSSGYLRLNSSLTKVNLQNLDRLNALVNDKLYRRRPDVIECKLRSLVHFSKLNSGCPVPCETEYCPNNGNCIEEDTGAGILKRAKCDCLAECTSVYEPVCSSNGETFANECKLRMDSCRRRQNYFVRYSGSCETGRRPRSTTIDVLPHVLS